MKDYAEKKYLNDQAIKFANKKKPMNRNLKRALVAGLLALLVILIWAWDARGETPCTHNFAGKHQQLVIIIQDGGFYVECGSCGNWLSVLNKYNGVNFTINQLAESGEICKIYGHRWYPVLQNVVTLQACYNRHFQPIGCSYPEERKCELCPAYQIKQPEEWKDKNQLESEAAEQPVMDSMRGAGDD